MIYKQPKVFILLEKSIPMGLIPSIRTIKGPHKTFRAIRYISSHPDRVNIITRDKINEDAIKPNKKTGIKWYCFNTENTEILTQIGWKKIHDITLKDMVATRNIITDVLEYQEPLNKYLYPIAKRELFAIESSHFEGEFTPNHSFFVTKNYKEKTVKKFIEIGEVKKYSSFKIPLTVKWDGLEIKEKIFSDGTKIPMEDWVSFLGIYLAEGHSRGTNGGRKDAEVGISQKPETYIWKQTENLLSRLPFIWKSYSHGFSCYSRVLYDELFPLGNSHEKYIPQDIKALSPRLLKILIRWMMLGDGGCGLNNDKWVQEIYYTVSKKLADDFQEVLIKVGKNGNIGVNQYMKNGPLYRVNLNKSKETGFYGKNRKQFIKKQTKECEVGCIEVPNHVFLIRVNGKAFWTGNSGVKVDEIAHIVDFKEPTETGLTRCVVKIDGKIGGKKYTDSKKERQAKIKWARLRHMEKNIATIRAKYEPLIGDANLTKKSFGIAMWCVDKTTPVMRIGSSAGNREDHFGTVTLQCKHIVQGEDGKVSIVFVGKSGVDWEVKVNDTNVASALLELKGNRDPEAKLLYDVERMDVIKWLGKFRVTAKDFRTYHASEWFIDFIKQYITPTKRKDQNAILKSVFIEVAKKLNNTPNVCRSKYVLPSLIEHWLSGGKF